MNSLGFENIFKKYNISCEVTKKPKRTKLQKKTQEQKYVSNKNQSCIQLGRSDESIAGNGALKRSNLSLPSFNNVSKSAKELKTKKMWDSIIAKRRHKPLDLVITKRITLDDTNSTQSQNSSSVTSDGGGNVDVNHESSSKDFINMNLTEDEDEDETNMNINLKTQSPVLSSNSFCREIKKKKRHSTPKYLYRHRPLPMLNTTTMNQTSKELSIQRPRPNGTNNLELSNSSTTSYSLNSFQRNTPKTFDINDSPSKSILKSIDQPTKLKTKLNLLLDSQNVEGRSISNAQEITNSWTISSSPSSSSSLSYNSFLINTPTTSQIIDTPTTSSQQSIDQPTELDLLLELIETENKKIERTKSNANEKSSPKRPCQKGGIEEHFLKILNQNKIAGKYLKHDKKYGLKTGIPLRVINLETSYGVNIATVQCLNNSNEFCTVIAPEMVAQVKIGSLIESFFDATSSAPYSLQTNGKQLDLFLQPFKLLVL